MTCRERVARVLTRRPVDRPAVQYMYSRVGFYEHGEKLNDLFEKYPGDFQRFTRHPIPSLGPEAFDAEGRYFERVTDEWGAEYEYRVYGIMGKAVNFPIKDIKSAGGYVFPELPEHVRNIDAYRERISCEKSDYFTFGGCGGLLECLWTLRGFENMMMDLCDDAPEIDSLMDRLTDYYRAHVEAAAAAGADGIALGDDYGSQRGPLFSKEIFIKKIKPRLDRILEPARKKDMYIHFHSCGLISEFFGDLRDLGVGGIWPQLPLYDMRELKRELDYYGFSIAIHTDRAYTMTDGRPEDVREAVMLENEIFKPKDGGAWFYVEPDTGFPFENITALVETVNNIR